MTQLTEKERVVLRAITLSEYQSADPDVRSNIDRPVWSFSLNNAETAAAGIKGKSISGVVGSLVRKGLAGTATDEGDDTVWITEKGFNALHGEPPATTPDPAAAAAAKGIVEFIIDDAKKDQADPCSVCGIPKMPSGFCNKCGRYDNPAADGPFVNNVENISAATCEQLISAAFGKAFAATDGRDDNRNRFESCERILFAIYSSVGEQFKKAASIADLKTAATDFNRKMETHSAAQATLSRYIRGGDLHVKDMLGNPPAGSGHAIAIENARSAKSEMESAAEFIRSEFSPDVLKYAIVLANDGQFPEFNTAILRFIPLD
jgi:hypothetical protein